MAGMSFVSNLLPNKPMTSPERFKGSESPCFHYITYVHINSDAIEALFFVTFRQWRLGGLVNGSSACVCLIWKHHPPDNNNRVNGFVQRIMQSIAAAV
jgi:hypothetical protein